MSAADLPDAADGARSLNEVPVSMPFADSPQFQRLLDGAAEVDLAQLALEIARDAYPRLDADAYLGRLDDLAARVRERCPTGARPRQVLGQINWVLFVEEEFRGNDEDYYEARNSYLNEVLDRRLGIPISLSTLYLAVAERVGLPMAGVNLPAHFVVRTLGPGEPLFVDAFRSGAVLDRDGCARRVAEVTGQDAVDLTDEQLAPARPAAVVARMLRNLKAVYLRDGQFAASLPVLRRLVALERGAPLERRDLGVACLHAGQPGEGIDHLNAYLDANPGAEDTEAVAAMLRVAWREVAAGN